MNLVEVLATSMFIEQQQQSPNESQSDIFYEYGTLKEINVWVSSLVAFVFDGKLYWTIRLKIIAYNFLFKLTDAYYLERSITFNV